MKKIFFLLTVILCAYQIKGQGLAFSQVLLITNVEDTVPPGKVWKIESILTFDSYHYPGGASCATSADALMIYLNGAARHLQYSAPGTGNTTIFLGANSYPFWIPAGTRLRTHCIGSTLSVIEFTVTP